MSLAIKIFFITLARLIWSPLSIYKNLENFYQVKTKGKTLDEDLLALFQLRCSTVERAELGTGESCLYDSRFGRLGILDYNRSYWTGTRYHYIRVNENEVNEERLFFNLFGLGDLVEFSSGENGKKPDQKFYLSREQTKLIIESLKRRNRELDKILAQVKEEEMTS